MPAQRDGLGERIGIGRTAEVFAWRRGQIIKLLRPGFPDQLGEAEAAIAALVSASGLAAPRFVGTRRADGRLGLVFARVDGPSMLDRLTARPWLVDSNARRFAALHAQMHAAPATGLPDYTASLRRAIEHAAGVLGATRRDAALRRTERLAAGTTVCHGDMHPGNVILAGSGPIVIDWVTAGAGPPEADLARTLFLLTGGTIPDAFPRFQRALITVLRRRFAQVYLRTYRRLHGVDERQLQLWRLPVLAARLGENVEGERDGLLARIDAELAGPGA